MARNTASPSPVVECALPVPRDQRVNPWHCSLRSGARGFDSCGPRLLNKAGVAPVNQKHVARFEATQGGCIRAEKGKHAAKERVTYLALCLSHRPGSSPGLFVDLALGSALRASITGFPPIRAPDTATVIGPSQPRSEQRPTHETKSAAS